MLIPGSAIFLLVPDANNKRILRPGKVMEVDRESVVAIFEEPIAPAPGLEVLTYFTMRGKFHQQGASVTEVRQPGPTPIIAFARAGEIVSAEQRQQYRVCTVTRDMMAWVGREKDCQIADISPEGFSVISKAPLALGKVIEVLLTLDDKSVPTPARVQTSKPRPDGSFRSGFLVPDKTGLGRKTLQQMTAALQREQLRRLSGAA